MIVSKSMGGDHPGPLEIRWKQIGMLNQSRKQGVQRQNMGTTIPELKEERRRGRSSLINSSDRCRFDPGWGFLTGNPVSAGVPWSRSS